MRMSVMVVAVISLLMATVRAGESTTNAPNLTIDPDKHVFGVPWKADREAIIKAMGEPTGEVQINKFNHLLLYGRSIGLMLNNGKLAECYIGDQLIDNDIAERITARSIYEDDWEIKPGIKRDMDFTDVAEVLKIARKPDYRVTFTSDAALWHLTFCSSRRDQGPTTYRLMKVHVKYLGP